MAANSQILEGLWGLGFPEDALRRFDTNMPPGDFQNALAAAGIPRDRITQAIKVADWRADGKKSVTDNIVSYLKIAGTSAADRDAVLNRARQLAGKSPINDLNMAQAAHEILPGQLFTNTLIKAGGGQILTNAYAGQAGVAAWNPMRGDAPPPKPGAPAAAAPAPAPPVAAPAAPAPAKGGTDVRAIQQALNARGAGLTVDGVMGPKTQAAMAKFSGGAAPATGGAAGGGGAPAPGAAPGGAQAPTKLAPGASFADEATFLKATYGYSAWVLDDPELRPIFERAAHEGWDKARLLGALTPTQFWQTHGDTQRLKIEEKNADPATYLKGVAGQKAQVVAEAGRLGVTVDPARLDAIATDAYQSGWTPNQLTAAVGAEFHYDPKSATQPGEVGTLKQIAASYLVPLDDATIQQWGSDILTGKVGDAEFTEHMKSIAKGLFPTMAAGIDAGQTVATLVAPYKSTIASTLEIDPATVDFMDPKWSRLLTQIDPKTNQPMAKPLYDTMTELRTNATYGYQKTTQAKDQAAQFSTALGQAWGLS